MSTPSNLCLMQPCTSCHTTDEAQQGAFKGQTNRRQAPPAVLGLRWQSRPLVAALGRQRRASRTREQVFLLTTSIEV